jgi:hypothetical protein
MHTAAPLSLPDRPLHRERWLRALVALPLVLGLLIAFAWQEGTRQWLSAVFLRDPNAAYELSERARLGIGESPDPGRARMWLVRAANLGEIRARLRLGREAFARAEAVSETSERRRLLLEAASLGDPNAHWALANEVWDGDLSARWRQGAAEGGSSDALLQLADESSDPALAAGLYRRAVRAARREGREGLWVAEAASDALWNHLNRYPTLWAPQDAALASQSKNPENEDEW